MKKFNKQMLFEDIAFPLQWDSGIYIFDSANQMIANIDDSQLANKIVGDYKEEVEDIDSEDTHEFAMHKGNFIRRDNHIFVGMVRGWGRLQYKDKPEERQDNIAKYLLNCLNLKTKEHGKSTSL